MALEARERPTALILTRQDVPTIDRLRFAPAEGLRRGGYVLADAPDGRPALILIATGSEVGLALAAHAELLARGVAVRVVSLPCWRLFDAQPQSYQDAVLPKSVGARLAIEAGVSQGWHRYVGDRGDVLGIAGFGASAPGAELMRDFGFTVENVCDRALKLLA